jgi:hypothetical protein
MDSRGFLVCHIASIALVLCSNEACICSQEASGVALYFLLTPVMANRTPDAPHTGLQI